MAAREIIVPIEGAFALDGLNELMNTVRLVKKRLNPNLEVLGALLTKYTPTNLSNNIYSELSTVFGDKVFQNVIRNSVKIGESQSVSNLLYIMTLNVLAQKIIWLLQRR